MESLLWNHLTSIWEASGRHLGDICEASGRLGWPGWEVSEVGAAGLGWPGWLAGLRQVRFNFDCENLGFLTKVPLKCKFYCLFLRVRFILIGKLQGK